MVDRQGLLDTGKEITKSAAGTFKSVAGTLAKGGKKAASKTSARVKDEFRELTDDTVTDQERARLERAQQEAQQEARKEARQEFQEEFRENVFDEAFAAELEEQRRSGPRIDRKAKSRSKRKKQVKRETLQTETQREKEQEAVPSEPPARQATQSIASAGGRAPLGGGGGGDPVALFGGAPQQTPQDRVEQQQAQATSSVALFGAPQQDPQSRQREPVQPADDAMQTLFGFQL